MKDNMIAALLSFLCSCVLCKIEIPLLRKWKAGQTILGYVKEHQGKSGTPTMGGLAFLLSASSVSLWFVQADRLFWVTLSIGMGYLAVGFLDDWIKIKTGKNEGLKPYQKIIFQCAIAVIVSIFCWQERMTEVYLPFWNKSLDLGIWFLPLCVFVFLATVNSVNLTDGLDGLAGGTSFAFFLCMGCMIVWQGGTNLPTLCFCLCGAVAAFLIFNVPKASVFMGDTGSLSLGGFVAAISIFSGNTLYLPVLGFPFVLSSISVLLQVIYYKATKGKRIFLMSPIHHHFQEKGYSESKISYCYTLLTFLLGILCLLSME